MNNNNQSLGICQVCGKGQLQRSGSDLVCPNQDFKIHEADWNRLWEHFESVKTFEPSADWLVNRLREYNLVDQGKDTDNDSP